MNVTTANVGTINQAAAGGGACAVWSGQTQETQDDYANIVTYESSQKLKITSSGTICKTATMWRHAGENFDIRLGYWTGPGKTGSQIGGYSDTVTVTGNVWITNSWSSSKPTLTADCYLYPERVSGAAACEWRYNSDGTSYQDANYCAYSITSQAPGDVDFTFVLFKE
jgi:hypothetical protein